MLENRTDVALAYQVERATIAMDGGPPLFWSGRPGVLAPHAHAGFHCRPVPATPPPKKTYSGLVDFVAVYGHPDIDEDQPGRFRLSQSLRFVFAEIANSPGEYRWRSEDIQSPRHDPV
jgi:hypothetical protein